MKIILRKLLTLCLVLSLLAAPAQALSLFGHGGAKAAEIAESKIQDDGVIRVYLKSLSSPDSLTLLLDGVYTVENDAGFRFARGTQLVVNVVGDKIYLTVGGLTMDMGASMTLTRHYSDEENNGIYIAESQKDTLYAGDLKLSVNEDGGIRAVLSINIEDYLLGVVAYEMSDSWPLEALKAQSVAARTYAMQRKWNAGSKDYDVVDTTADQVYKGYDPDYTNVAQAVRETTGVVGTYKGGFATCYYTASNGGEVALPSDVWSGGGDYGYLERKADPYDLENPNSLVDSIGFSADCAESPDLKAMLQERLADALQAQGIAAEEPVFESVVSLEAVDPVTEGSIMYRKLRFGVQVSVLQSQYQPAANDVLAPGSPMGDNSADASLSAIDLLRRLRLNSPFVKSESRQTLDETIYVELSVYDQIKDGLGLSLNGSDYEVVSVVAGGDFYTIEMRRFGHGVGMSQRGAQRMAGAHDKRYTDILFFYYPGMNLEKIAWNTPELVKLSDLPDSVGFARPDPTPTPTPAPLPALQAGEYYAKVALGDASSSLNVRSAAGTQNQVVATFSNGRRLIVCSEPDAEGWVSVKTAEVSGYVKLEYLVKE